MKVFRFRYVIGIVIIIFGLLFLTNNLGFTQVSLGQVIRIYWPVILILWGLSLLAPGGKGTIWSQALSGGLVSLLGALFLARNLRWLNVDLSLIWRVFWPVVLIIAGLSLLRGRTTFGAGRIAFMGGIELTKNQWELKPNESFIALMGGMDIDLGKARLPDGESILDLTAFMGGIDVIVPPGLPILCECSALLGGVDFLGEGSGGLIAGGRFESDLSSQDSRRVFIQARALMGGITIKRAH